MNQARKLARVSESNPGSVLRSIAATQGNIIEEARGQSGQVDASRPVSTEVEVIGFDVADSSSEVELVDVRYSSCESGESEASYLQEVDGFAEKTIVPTIKLRINPATTNEETVDQVLESCAESAEQVQQLAKRLSQNENELNQREFDLNQRIKGWDQRVREQESDFDRKLDQLEQQSSQVRCQQLHLMQLQTDIVKSHEATREAVESLVVEAGADKHTIATLKALKYQISGRFDYIARRWEHLSSLLQLQRDHETATKSVDDSVDWAGEYA